MESLCNTASLKKFEFLHQVLIWQQITELFSEIIYGMYQSSYLLILQLWKMIEILDSEMLRRAECDLILLICHLNLTLIYTLLKLIHNCIAIYVLFTQLESNTFQLKKFKQLLKQLNSKNVAKNAESMKNCQTSKKSTLILSFF